MVVHADKLKVGLQREERIDTGALVSTSLKLKPLGTMKLESSHEEVEVKIHIQGTLRHMGNNVYESIGVLASFHSDNLYLELTGVIRFELSPYKRLHSIFAEFSKDDHTLRVKKQDAKWHGVLMKLDPFSFILKSGKSEIGRGTFKLPHTVLLEQLRKIIMS